MAHKSSSLLYIRFKLGPDLKCFFLVVICLEHIFFVDLNGKSFIVSVLSVFRSHVLIASSVYWIHSLNHKIVIFNNRNQVLFKFDNRIQVVWFVQHRFWLIVWHGCDKFCFGNQYRLLLIWNWLEEVVLGGQCLNFKKKILLFGIHWVLQSGLMTLERMKLNSQSEAERMKSEFGIWLCTRSQLAVKDYSQNRSEWTRNRKNWIVFGITHRSELRCSEPIDLESGTFGFGDWLWFTFLCSELKCSLWMSISWIQNLIAWMLSLYSFNTLI